MFRVRRLMIGMLDNDSVSREAEMLLFIIHYTMVRLLIFWEFGLPSDWVELISILHWRWFLIVALRVTRISIRCCCIWSGGGRGASIGVNCNSIIQNRGSTYTGCSVWAKSSGCVSHIFSFMPQIRVNLVGHLFIDGCMTAKGGLWVEMSPRVYCLFTDVFQDLAHDSLRYPFSRIQAFRITKWHSSAPQSIRGAFHNSICLFYVVGYPSR